MLHVWNTYQHLDDFKVYKYGQYKLANIIKYSIHGASGNDRL
jgi:hypothetical protein